MHPLSPPTKALSALALVALLMMIACSTQYGRRSNQRIAPYRAIAQRAAPAPVAPAITRQVEILSEPPGARIEVNDNYIGDAPITTTFHCSSDGRFLETTRIRALPTQPGDYVQSKFFSGGYPTDSALRGYSTSNLNDTIPARIFFDMRLGPVNRDINVNVQ